jgi:hypothetical protein
MLIDNYKNLFPNNLGSNAYISDIAKKSHKNNELQNEQNKKFKVYFPKYDGKIYDPTINKALNILKQNEEQIIKDIHKINNNINLLKNETSMNNVNNIHDLNKEKKKIEDKIKALEKEKSLFIEKLEEIKNRRNSMNYQQEKELGIIEKNKKLKLKKFIDDLNNKEKNEIIEEKIKKIQEDSKKLQLKMKSDLEEVINKKNFKMDQLEKEKEDKIKKYLNDMKEEEKKYIKTRNQKAKEQVLKLKELQLENNKEQKNKKTMHLYKKIEDKFLKNEEDKVKIENKSRKEKMKHIDLNEFNELAKNFDEMKSKQLYESKLKIKKQREIWSQRYKLIPEYINPLNKVIEEEKNIMKKKEQEKILEKQKLKDLQKQYKVPKPLIIAKEKTIDIVDQRKQKSKKILIKSSSYSDVIRQKMMVKFNTTKNKKEKGEEADTNINKAKDIINFKLPLICLKEKYRKVNKSFEKDKNNNQNHELSTDYLNQRRLINEKNRERKRNLGELSNLDYSKTNDIRKLIKENGLDENMLKMAKSKLEILDEKKKQKALLLKLNGGIANKPDLGEEICDLMIDSIQAKLSILQEIENLDGNDNIPILNDEQTEDQNKK